MFTKFIFLFCLSVAAAAADLQLSLDGAVAYALRHNPGLAAARWRIEEARGRLQQSGRLSNPELQAAFLRSLKMPAGSVEIGFMQKFPITARLRFEKAVSRAELAAAELEVRDAERKLAGDVRAAAVKLVAVRGQRTLREQQLATGRELAEFTRNRVAAGEASMVDATQLELEVSQLTVDLLALETLRATLVGDLRPLLGVDAGSVEIKGDLAAPRRVDDRRADATARADLLAAQQGIEAARQSARLARAQRWEDIGVGLSSMGERMEDMPEGFQRDYFAGIRVSVPLPLWNDNSGRIREAVATLARREREADAIAVNIRAEIAAARDEMAALVKLIEVMDGSLLPASALVEDQSRSAYSAGQSPLNEVLGARTRRLELLQRRLDALRDYHLARVRYETAAGGSSVRKHRATSARATK